MQGKTLFNKKEIISLTIGSLVLGFIFSFREWGYGNINYNIGLTNLVRFFLLSFIVLLVYQISHKLIAKRFGAESTFKLWSIQRFWFTKNSKIQNINFLGKRFKKINMGLILPILLALITNGIIKFPTVGSSEVTSITNKRITKKFKNISEFEIAKIHFVGPLTCLLLALILNNLKGFDSLTEISYLIAIFSMLPFSGLDGGKILFGSPALYLFGISLILISIILMNLFSPILTLIFSLIIALILLFLFLSKNL